MFKPKSNSHESDGDIICEDQILLMSDSKMQRAFNSMKQDGHERQNQMVMRSFLSLRSEAGVKKNSGEFNR